jgi:HAD superfamily hydrolase (TIGR01549 family)
MSGPQPLPLARQPLQPRPELVFFDIGDTLLRVDPSWTGAYLAAATSWGLRVDAAALAAAFAQALGEGLWDSPGPFEATPEGSYQRIKGFDVRAMALLGYHDLPDEFYRHLGRFFERRAAWRVFPDVHPALEAIAAAGIRRAVISNWVWALPELLHDLEIAHHFEVIVASARVGYVKPQREIFAHALDVTGVRAERALHVGDNPDADVAGASSVGIRPVLLDRGGRFPTGLSDRPDVAVVRDLFELLRLLGVAEPGGAPAREA